MRDPRTELGRSTLVPGSALTARGVEEERGTDRLQRPVVKEPSRCGLDTLSVPLNGTSFGPFSPEQPEAGRLPPLRERWCGDHSCVMGKTVRAAAQDKPGRPVRVGAGNDTNHP